MITIEPTAMKASTKEIKGKAAVLAYMKNGKNPWYSPMMYKDRETGKDAISAYYLGDDKYMWSSDTIYHFEKYNYPLPKEFVDYVLKGAK